MNKKFKDIVDSEDVWKQYVRTHLGGEHDNYNGNWKQLCKILGTFRYRVPSWSLSVTAQWDPSKKVKYLTISEDKRTISRDVSDGSNPAALAKYPLNKSRNKFELEVKNMGNWASLGISQIGLVYDGGGKHYKNLKNNN